MSTRGTLLLVDDLPQNIRLLEAVLAPRGYAIVKAESGREALEKVAAEPVDLVLLDILMPEMDGYGVCRALREDPATQFLPVVMVTASGDQEKVAAIEAGADDFITKPFDQAELARARLVAAADQALPRHDRGPGRGARRVEPRARAAGHRAGRAARAPRPAAALPVAAGRRARRVLGRRLDPREPPARDHGGVLRPARLHRVRRDGRAGGRDGRPRRVPRGGRRPRPPLRGHARAVHGRRRRWSSSTTRSRARTRRSARCAWPSRCASRVGQLAEGWRRKGYDLELRDRHRAGPRDARADRLRGPLRLRGDRQRDEPRRAAVRRGGGRARSSSASASTRRPRTWSPPTRSGT